MINKESSPKGEGLKVGLNVPFKLHPDFIAHIEKGGIEGRGTQEAELDIEGLGKGQIDAELVTKTRSLTPLDEIRLRHVPSVDYISDELRRLQYEAWDISLTIEGLTKDQTEKLSAHIFYQGNKYSSGPVFENEGEAFEELGTTLSFFFDFVDESGQPLIIKKEADFFSELLFLIESSQH